MYIMCVFGFAFPAFQLLCFPLFFFTRFLPISTTVHVRYMNSNHNIWSVFREQYIRVLFTDLQISFFINFFIKNGSHGTIYTFKNYFATVISAISFQFQQNKSYPNRPNLSLFISSPKSPTELQCWMSTNQAVRSSSTISAVHRFVNFKSNQKGQENVCVYIYIILFYFFMTSTLNKEEDSLEPPLGLNHRCMTSAARRPEPCINY